jgi:hypothetical protein
VPPVQPPVDRSPAAPPHVDTAERREPHEHPQVVQLGHLDVVDEQGDVHVELGPPGHAERDHAGPGSERPAVGLPKRAVLIPCEPQPTALDIRGVAAALITVRDQDPLIAGTVVQLDADPERPQRRQPARAIPLQRAARMSSYLLKRPLDREVLPGPHAGVGRLTVGRGWGCGGRQRFLEPVDASEDRPEAGAEEVG